MTADNESKTSSDVDNNLSIAGVCIILFVVVFLFVCSMLKNDTIDASQVFFLIIIMILLFGVIVFLFSSYFSEEDWETSMALMRNIELTPTSIPKNIYQTMENNNIPDFIKQNNQTWKDQNPEYNYYFYTDPQRRDFIAKYFPQKVVDAYDMLIPGAFRADLWRYCILYIKGGVYVDIATVCITPLKEMPLDVEFIASRDREYDHVYNSFIASFPRHPFLKKAIAKIVDIVHSGAYEDSPLAITGPKLLGKSINMVLNRNVATTFKVGLQHINGHTFYLYTHDPLGTIRGDFNPLLLKDYSERYQSYKKTYNEPYDVLWRRKQIYKPKPTHPLIPRYIHQTMKNADLSPGMTQAKQSWIDKNPEYTHCFYTDDDCRDFIAAHFDDRVLKAFDKLIPGAFRADLWRYCVLYIKGGVYADIPTVCEVPLHDLIITSFVSAKDRPPGAIFNCFMASVPGHPFLKQAIDQAVNNIHANYYGASSLDITGPGLLGAAINKVLGKKETENFNIGNQTINGFNFMLYEHHKAGGRINHGDKCIIRTRYSKKYHDDLYKQIGGKKQKYGELWKNRKVYWD